MEIEFNHKQSAHCENGTASNLLRNKNFEISEPMVFGIGSGLFFVYLPFIKVNYAPAISYRPLPGKIFNRLAKRLGIKIKRMKFQNKQKAQQVLDHNLEKGNPCGLQVGVYYLPYFPEEYRFHFNAHNLVVYGKKDNKYLISDPVMETISVITPKELEKARFAKGAFAPRGHIYYPIKIPRDINYPKVIKSAIYKTCKDMLSPFPIVGVRGIRMVARAILKWSKNRSPKEANHYLAQMVRMQEEIGTGGGGFRYIYAAFLQEASTILNNDNLFELSKEMTEIGDSWRDFAVNASRVYKKRSHQEDVYQSLSNELLYLADREEAFYKKLKKSI